MKTDHEWLSDWTGGNPNSVLELIQRVQSDAFHAGEMKGLRDAKRIVKGAGERGLNAAVEFKSPQQTE